MRRKANGSSQCRSAKVTTDITDAIDHERLEEKSQTRFTHPNSSVSKRLCEEASAGCSDDTQTQKPSLRTSCNQMLPNDEPFWQQFEEVDRLCPTSEATTWQNHAEYDGRPRFYYRGLGWFHQSLVMWIDAAPQHPMPLGISFQSSFECSTAQVEHRDTVTAHEDEEADLSLHSESDAEESLVHSASETTAATEICSSTGDTSLDRGLKWIKRRRRRREVQKAWQGNQAKS